MRIRMTHVATLARFITGIIFIFSGLIKLNDPVGTQIKLEEYFEVFAQDLPALAGLFHGLIPLALFFSVVLCAAEVILGIALLVRYRPRLVTWLLLVLILFFTFLTFYSAYFNKVTDCGCFGDAIKLAPWTSFGKDIFLLVLILIILYKRRRLTPLPTGIVVAVAAVLSFGLAFYAIRHSPPLDLLPYKVGASIPLQMQPSEPLRYQYIMTKEGREERFEEYPTDTTYVFKEMRLINENAKPKITDYRVWNDEEDLTQSTFEGQKLFIIIKNTPDLNTAAFLPIKELTDQLQAKKISVAVLTSSTQAEIEELLKAHQLNVPYYYADATVLKTISRSNPGIWLMQEGVVKGKWHYNDTPTLHEVVKILGE